MNLGLITYNQIINDSLIPNLRIFGDEKNLRKLIIYIDNDIAKHNKCYFLSLIENVNYASIKVKDILIEEWKYLAKQNNNYRSDPIFIKMNKIIWTDTVQHFYFKISINCAFSHLLWLNNTIKNEKDDRVIAFKIMRSLKDIGQLIIDCKQNTNESESGENVFEIINMILSFVWLKILSLYHTHVFMDGLPLMKEEVIYNITYRNNRSEKMNFLREAILLSLNLLEEKAVKHIISNDDAADSEIPDINELSKGIISEINSLKSVIKKIEIHKDEIPEYIKPKEAAIFLKISKTTLNSWRKKAKIKDFRFLGNRFEYNKNELVKLKTQTNEDRKNNFRE